MCCLNDLCHDGCARMAGHQFNKKRYFSFGGEAWGFRPALPLCVSCRYFCFCPVLERPAVQFNSSDPSNQISCGLQWLVLSNKQKYHNPFSFKCAPSSCGLLGNLLIERISGVLVLWWLSVDLNGNAAVGLFGLLMPLVK
ncbi:hypothetical protein ABFS82_14G045600 [Erythranthe guttata]